jgi:endonuclease/exonuclease/phosphatase family metal-dependent hydrolase
MPFYNYLNSEKDLDRRKRTAEGLLRLKAGLDDPAKGVPDHALDDRALIATWNIREFDSSKGGDRGIESLLYIAQVISAFDIVAVQEVRENLRPLNTLLRYLGEWWHVLVTDVTRGKAGNFERLAFLYDTRKVRFSGFVGEVVRPRGKDDAAGEFVEQFARTPFLVGFQVGWLKFTICTAHILYGTANALDPRRIKEIGWLASMLADQHLEQHAWSNNIVLLGDFNIFDTTDATLKAITDAGFHIPPELTTKPSNLTQTKHYDQIAFFQPPPPANAAGATPPVAIRAAGVFAWQDYVYRTKDAAAYEADRLASGSAMAYPTWRTYQMSDHDPMWVELSTDDSQRYLEKIAAGTGAGPAMTESIMPAIAPEHVG